MARRVIIRSRSYNTAVAQLEEMVAADYKAIWKQHIDDLEYACESIVEVAQTLVPERTGKLHDSISARVSRSNCWPGLIVTASAFDKGFDYALIQEQNEEFEHYKPDAQAHYLRDAFFGEIEALYSDWTGKEIELPDEEYIPYEGGG